MALCSSPIDKLIVVQELICYTRGNINVCMQEDSNAWRNTRPGPCDVVVERRDHEIVSCQDDSSPLLSVSLKKEQFEPLHQVDS